MPSKPNQSTITALVVFATLLASAQAQNDGNSGTDLRLPLPRMLEAGSRSLVLNVPNISNSITEVWLGGNKIKFTSQSNSLTLDLPANLAPGEYPLRLVAAEKTILNAKSGLIVVPVAQNSKFPLEETFSSGFEPNALTLLFAPERRAVLEQVWRGLGFSLEFYQPPAITNSTGVCGKAIAALRGPNDQAAIANLNRLVDGLYAAGQSDGTRIAARATARGPAAVRPSIWPSVQPSNPQPAVVQRPLLGKNLPPSLTVAILDTGVTAVAEFAALGHTLDAARARNFSFGGNPLDVRDQAQSRETNAKLLSERNTGHGTAVAAMVGRGAGTTTLNLLPLRACDQDGLCRSPSLVAGVCYAASLSNAATPVRVLNISLSGPNHDPLLYEALAEAAGRGISIVVAAGNERNPAPASASATPASSFPAQYSLAGRDAAGNSLAAIPGLITVAALVQEPSGYQPSAFSRFGPWVTLSAVGEQLILPSADGLGSAVFDGTSFAAPQVSGFLASLRAQNPALSPLLAKLRLLGQTKAVPGCSPERCGSGILEMR
jgi:hypothetical protein